MTFGILLGDDGSVTLLSYDWQIEIRVPGHVFAAMGLFDEAREGFDWQADSVRAAKLLIMKAELVGLKPSDPIDFGRKIQRVCEPGPGFTGPMLVQLERIDD